MGILVIFLKLICIRFIELVHIVKSMNEKIVEMPSYASPVFLYIRVCFAKVYVQICIIIYNRYIYILKKRAICVVYAYTLIGFPIHNFYINPKVDIVVMCNLHLIIIYLSEKFESFFL